MKKGTALFILFIVTCTTVFSQGQGKTQPSTELGVFAGISFYRGDLNNFSNPLVFINPAGGLMVRRNFNPRFSYRINALYGKVEASDAKTNSLAQQQRNLSFRSNIFEGSFQFELNYLDFMIGSEKASPASTYLFLGVGAFYFNPQANYNGSWIDLQPLRTEGQASPYKRLQPSVPMGVGIKMALGKRGCLGFEWGMRKTFTDYIDDVSGSYADPTVLASTNGTASAALSDRSIDSDPITNNNIGRQRGNSQNKDWYSFLGITLSFKFKQKENTCFYYN